MTQLELCYVLHIGRPAVVVELGCNFPLIVHYADLTHTLRISVKYGALGENWSPLG